jgi:two-component system, chemotaxis family, protein-glutamate methylesterase/glutaminase
VDERPPVRIVVVGASAGGVEALQRFVAALPAGLAVPVVVVLHISPNGVSVLPQILSRAGRLPARHPSDGERLEPGHVYVAPPDHHLRLQDGHVRLVRGPRENGHRPAVDPLFRTAAASFGPAAAGVILSGALDDGTIGLAAIKQAGGTTLVQDPDEALYPSMPQSAITRVGVDHVAPIAELARLVTERVTPEPGRGDEVEEREGEAVEPQQEHDIEPVGNPVGDVAAFTCPECSGTLWEVPEGGLVTLRCRVGHAYTEEAYEANKSEALEAALWTALQTLEEKADFARRLAARAAAAGNDRVAGRHEEQRRRTLRQGELVREALAGLTVEPVDERQAS